MRLEHIPIILGALVALIGLGFIADGWMPDTGTPSTERRRRMRTERNRVGEAIVGLGILCMAAALIGRDTWRYGTVSVLAGGVLIVLGAIMNAAFLKESVVFRGPARRGVETADGVATHGRSIPEKSPSSGSRASGGSPKHTTSGSNKAATARSSPSRVSPLELEVARPANPVLSADAPAVGEIARPTPGATDAVLRPTAVDPPAPATPRVAEAPRDKSERRLTPRGKKR
jgi:hypothetical protein